MFYTSTPYTSLFSLLQNHILYNIYVYILRSQFSDPYFLSLGSFFSRVTLFLTLHCSPLADIGHIFLHKHKLMTTFSTGHPLHTSLSLQFSRSMFRDLCHHSPGSGAGGPGPVCAPAWVGFKMTRQLGSQSS